MPPFIASLVSTLLANNLPKVAQAVVDKGFEYVEEKTGVQLKPDMSPEELDKLREAAAQHEEFRIAQDNANTADARAMQKAALAQDDVLSKRFVMYLASFWSACCATYIAAITFSSIPEANVRFADTILGFMLGTLLGTILNFFFGSSASSTQKNSLLTDLAKAIRK